MNITNDKFIFNTIKNMAPVVFKETQICQYIPQTKISSTESEVIDMEIAKLLKEVLIPTSREPGEFISGIFTKVKKHGNRKMMINLKKFNHFLEFKHCKLESIGNNLDFVTENC